MSGGYADNRGTNPVVDSFHESPLESRLKQLCRDDSRQAATVLARSVLRSADVLNVELTESTVTIVTEHFTGEHPYHVNAVGEVTLEQSGEYRCTIDDVDLEFSTATMNEDAYSRTLDRIADEDGLQVIREGRESPRMESIMGPGATGREGGLGSPRSILHRIRHWLR